MARLNPLRSQKSTVKVWHNFFLHASYINLLFKLKSQQFFTICLYKKEIVGINVFETDNRKTSFTVTQSVTCVVRYSFQTCIVAPSQALSVGLDSSAFVSSGHE